MLPGISSTPPKKKVQSEHRNTNKNPSYQTYKGLGSHPMERQGLHQSQVGPSQGSFMNRQQMSQSAIIKNSPYLAQQQQQAQKQQHAGPSGVKSSGGNKMNQGSSNHFSHKNLPQIKPLRNQFSQPNLHANKMPNFHYQGNQGGNQGGQGNQNGQGNGGYAGGHQNYRARDSDSRKDRPISKNKYSTSNNQQKYGILENLNGQNQNGYKPNSKSGQKYRLSNNHNNNHNSMSSLRPIPNQNIPLKPNYHYQRNPHQQMAQQSKMRNPILKSKKLEPLVGLSPMKQNKKTVSNYPGPHQQQSRIQNFGQSTKAVPKFEMQSQNILPVIGIRTKAGQNGFQTKINQDAASVQRKFLDQEDIGFLAVFDGHGVAGHKVSSFLQQNCHQIFKETLIKVLNKESPEQLNSSALNDTSLVTAAYIEAFHSTNDQLNRNRSIPTELSGSTGVSLLITKDMIFCANCGDSRAIVGSYNALENRYEGIALSRDHHPTEPDERRRVEQMGGRVEPFKMMGSVPVGPPRIWRKHEDAPGLMMSRTFGDRLGHTCGVICTPEVTLKERRPEMKFVVLGSDGIFEVLDNMLVAQIVGKYMNQKNCEMACQELVDRAVMKWKLRGNYVDDIIAVVAFLNNDG